MRLYALIHCFVNCISYTDLDSLEENVYLLLTEVLDKKQIPVSECTYMHVCVIRLMIMLSAVSKQSMLVHHLHAVYVYV